MRFKKLYVANAIAVSCPFLDDEPMAIAEVYCERCFKKEIEENEDFFPRCDEQIITVVSEKPFKCDVCGAEIESVVWKVEDYRLDSKEEALLFDKIVELVDESKLDFKKVTKVLKAVRQFVESMEGTALAA